MPETPNTKAQIYLLCNAHLDPVWLWEWEEGAAEALSTFRTAADLCEAFDGFVFNHNEAVLYQWVEAYEPALFARIQRLVREGRWHIMGGWYLQPDCNMPSGESFVRQILVGRRYFMEKFGARPTTAINFDPFGHTRGLVQILAKSGYDSYLFCRPSEDWCHLPDSDFVWVGYDGSEVVGHRTMTWYNSRLGGARQKIEAWTSEHPERPLSLVLWGVGNHGGGPSHKDVRDLSELIAETTDAVIAQATPEDYFAALRARHTDGEGRLDLPRHADDINPWAVGCYTSQIQIKQHHRALENALYATEKMASVAAQQGLLAYPEATLAEAQRDLLFAEFHDILPGSSIQPVEQMSLRVLDHGLEILSRLRARTFFALAQGQPRAAEGEIPILVYNPHPFPVQTTVECEFQLADQNWEESFTQVQVTRDGEALPTQVEKEHSNLNMDWRKRAVFDAVLEPSQMNRFDCRLELLSQKPPVSLAPHQGQITFETNDLEVVINTQTGLLDRYSVHGTDILAPDACAALVLRDDEDPWGMRGRGYRDVIAQFKLMTPVESAVFSGVEANALPAVRVIEDGAVRTVVEAVFTYGRSALCLRYLLPKRGTEVGLQVRVLWNEKSRLLKLALPTLLRGAEYLGQAAYGLEALPTNGDEAVAQKWVAAVDRAGDRALTCINDGIYGSDFCDGELRLSLLRSPAYSGHPIYDRPVVPQDRFMPRIDQGERLYQFWLNAGPVTARLEAVDREALARNERPFALSFFPHGAGELPEPGPVLADDVVQMTAYKQASASGADTHDAAYIIRLFEPTGRRRETVLALPSLGLSVPVALDGFEIKTLRIDPHARTVVEVDLMEEL
jgi:alpha-mannosidase